MKRGQAWDDGDAAHAQESFVFKKQKHRYSHMCVTIIDVLRPILGGLKLEK